MQCYLLAFCDGNVMMMVMRVGVKENARILDIGGAYILTWIEKTPLQGNCWFQPQQCHSVAPKAILDAECTFLFPTAHLNSLISLAYRGSVVVDDCSSRKPLVFHGRVGAKHDQRSVRVHR